MYDYERVTGMLSEIKLWMKWISWLMIRSRTRNCLCYNVLFVERYNRCVVFLLFRCLCLIGLVCFWGYVEIVIPLLGTWKFIFLLLKPLCCLCRVDVLCFVGTTLFVSFLFFRLHFSWSLWLWRNGNMDSSRLCFLTCFTIRCCSD